MIANGQPSLTALTAAAARAAHLIVDDEPVIFADTLAEAMLGERAEELIAYHRAHGTHPVLAGARAQVTCRSRYAEDGLARGIERGIGQYVLLGAGLDSFAYRSPLASRVRVFEVDHPATQEWKRRVRKAPVGVRFVPVDFTRDSLADALGRAGFDAAQPAFVSWLGVTMYLDESAIEATGSALGGFAAGSELVVDYMLPAGLRDAAGQMYADLVGQAVAERGEPWRSVFAPGAMAALLPDIVPRDRLAPANALLGGAASTAAIAAPALAGLVVAVLGPGTGFAVQAVLLAAAAGSLRAGIVQATEATKVTRVVRRRGAKDAKAKDAKAKDAGVARHRGALRAGWTEFTRIRWLWLLTGQWLVFSMLTLAPVTVLGPALAQRYLGGAAAWGVISASLALGAVGGQFGAGRIRPPTRPGLAVACLMPVMTAEALALGLGAPLAAVAAAAVATGLAMGVQMVFFRTAMQTSVRPDVLARVAAIDLVGSEGGQPVGYALAGPLAAVTGAHAFLTASAAVMAVAAAAFTFVPALRTDASASPQGEGPG